MSYFLEVQQVSKFYSTSAPPALDNINFNLPPGMRVAVIGENGSGKSTLLRVLAGLEDIDQGKILLSQVPIKGPSQQLVSGNARIKLLLQDAKLRPNLSVVENLRYELRGYPSMQANNRISELLMLANLTGMANKKPEELSGGERQRAALAVALADNPDLLLLDEPFSSYDLPRQRAAKWQLYETIRQNGTSVMFSTHDTEEALAFADLILVLRGGKIIQLGTPFEVYNFPADLYTMQLFGCCCQLPPGSNTTSEDSDHKYVRAEHLRLTIQKNAPYAGVVTRVVYLGANFELTVMVQQQELIVLNDTNRRVGELVNITYEPDKVVRFKTTEVSE